MKISPVLQIIYRDRVLTPLCYAYLIHLNESISTAGRKNTVVKRSKFLHYRACKVVITAFVEAYRVYSLNLELITKCFPKV